MEHREKRPRLGDAEGPIFDPAVDPRSTETLSAASSMPESSAAMASATTNAASETMQDTPGSLTSEPVTTPDKSTWQGWAEIENDPVRLTYPEGDYSVRPFPNLY